MNLEGGRYGQVSVSLLLEPHAPGGGHGAGEVALLPQNDLIRAIITDSLTGLSPEQLIDRDARHKVLARILKELKHSTDEPIDPGAVHRPGSAVTTEGVTVSDVSAEALAPAQPLAPGETLDSSSRPAPSPASRTSPCCSTCPSSSAVEIGRTTMTIRETLAIGPGSVISLDRLAGEPVDLLVNGRRIARGEVVAIDEEFGLRVTEVVSAAQRLDASEG